MSFRISQIEPLESRQHFAVFTAAEYMALYDGRSTKLSGVINNNAPTGTGLIPSANTVGDPFDIDWEIPDFDEFPEPPDLPDIPWDPDMEPPPFDNLDDPFLDPLDLPEPLNSDNRTPNARKDGSGNTPSAINTSVVMLAKATAKNSGDRIGYGAIYSDKGRKGIYQYDYFIGGDSNILTDIVFNTPVKLLPQRFTATDYVTGGTTVSEWTNLACSAAFKIPGTPLTGQKLTGTNTGRTIVTDNGPTQLLGIDTNTLDVVIDHSMHFTLVQSGKTYNINVNLSEKQVLAKGAGLVAGGYTALQVGISGPGTNIFVTHSPQYETLTSSSELSSFTRITGSTLRIGGTNHDDVIGVGYNGSTSSALVSRNGMTKAVSLSGITRVVIDSAGGDDVVGPLKLGRTKSVLVGGLGNDYLVGGSGRDLIYGGEGNDTVVGGPGLDTLYGDAGNDILNGLNGADFIDGGNGTDTTKTDATDTRIAVEVLI